jgi:5-formaminoimidazole-4-carboxamide-1-beta-D-ribofuranosyl 5'-monophosphate synthetase
LSKEFGSQEEVEKVMKAYKIRTRDLEMRTIEDFMDGESARIWEARYSYFYKKKKVKVELLRKILKQ